MKKVLLSSVAALAVFSAAAPAFYPEYQWWSLTLLDHMIHVKHESQTEFVNGRKANEYVGGHQD